MDKTVYTNYWVNKRAKMRKEHGSYETEEEAVQGIKAWWELHQDNYQEVEYTRTNTGALEITYGDDNYYYRIEKREIAGTLPRRKVKMRTKGEIHSQRLTYSLDDESFFYEELAEPYRDRLSIAMADGQKLREYIYDFKGRPIRKTSQ